MFVYHSINMQCACTCRVYVRIRVYCPILVVEALNQLGI